MHSDNYLELTLSDDPDVATDLWIHWKDDTALSVLKDVQSYPSRLGGVWHIPHTMVEGMPVTAYVEDAKVRYFSVVERRKERPDAEITPLTREFAVDVCATIQQDWALDDDTMCALLDVTEEEWAGRPDIKFTAEQTRRASYLLAIWASLQRLYSGELPHMWMGIPNKNPLFNGKTPIDHVLANGEEGLASIRALLEGWLGHGALDCFDMTP